MYIQRKHEIYNELNKIRSRSPAYKKSLFSNNSNKRISSEKNFVIFKAPKYSKTYKTRRKKRKAKQSNSLIKKNQPRIFFTDFYNIKTASHGKKNKTKKKIISTSLIKKEIKIGDQFVKLTQWKQGKQKSLPSEKNVQINP